MFELIWNLRFWKGIVWINVWYRFQFLLR